MYQEQGNELRDIFMEYLEQMKELDEKMQECLRKREQSNSKDDLVNKNVSSVLNTRFNYETSHARNQQLLKDLVKTNAILRTQSVFSPTEQELRDLAITYRKILQS